MKYEIELPENTDMAEVLYLDEARHAHSITAKRIENVRTLGSVRVNSQKRSPSNIGIYIEIEGEPFYVSEKYSEISEKINHGKLG